MSNLISTSPNPTSATATATATAIVSTWEPVGVIQTYSFEEVIEVLTLNVPTRMLPIVKLVEKKGLGQRKFRHYRSYQCLVEQPVAGKHRGDSEFQAGRDGRVTLTWTAGPVGFTKSVSFSYPLPRMYSEGGE